MMSRKQKIQTSLKNMAETFDIHGNFSLLLDHLSENGIIIKKADKQSTEITDVIKYSAGLHLYQTNTEFKPFLNVELLMYLTVWIFLS